MDQWTKYFIAVIVCCLCLRVLWETWLNDDIIMSSALAFSCLKKYPRETPFQSDAGQEDVIPEGKHVLQRHKCWSEWICQHAFTFPLCMFLYLLSPKNTHWLTKWAHSGWSSHFQRTAWGLRPGFNLELRIGFKLGSGFGGEGQEMWEVLCLLKSSQSTRMCVCHAFQCETGGQMDHMDKEWTVSRLC